MKTKITPATILAMKAGDKVHDTETPGLYVEANRDGTISWRYTRRVPRTVEWSGGSNGTATWKGSIKEPARDAGKIVKATLGTTRDYTIPDARDWASAMNGRVARGFDPVGEAKENFAVEKAAAGRAMMTVELAASYYVSTIRANGLHQEKTIAGKEARLKDILPAIGSKPLDKVTFRDLQNIVAAKNAAGFPSASNHLVADIKTMFRWFTRQGNLHTGLEIDPSERVHRLNANVRRKRVFSMKELRIFLRAIADCDEFERQFMILLLLSGQRFDNVMTAKKDHWCPDVNAWEIERTKNGEPNVVPLGPWGRTFFGGTGWVFPSPKIDGPRRTNSGSIAMKVRAKMNRIAGEELEKWIPHDLRRVISTNMSRLMVKKEVREAVLAHTEGGVAGLYNRWEYLPEKAEALAKWEAEIIRLAIEEGVADKLGCPKVEPIPIRTNIAA